MFTTFTTVLDQETYTIKEMLQAACEAQEMPSLSDALQYELTDITGIDFSNPFIAGLASDVVIDRTNHLANIAYLVQKLQEASQGMHGDDVFEIQSRSGRQIYDDAIDDYRMEFDGVHMTAQDSNHITAALITLYFDLLVYMRRKEYHEYIAEQFTFDVTAYDDNAATVRERLQAAMDYVMQENPCLDFEWQMVGWDELVKVYSENGSK